MVDKNRNGKDKNMPGLTVRAAVRGLVAGASVLAAAPAAFAQDAAVDTSGWECSSCPFDDGKVASSVELGAINVSDDGVKFGEYSGLNEKGTYAVVGGDASQMRSDGLYWSVRARDLGLDSRSASVEAGKAGRLELSLDYDRIPHYIHDSTVTPFLGAGDSPLTLPAGFVRGANTRAITTLPASLRRADLRTNRETIAAGARFLGGANWALVAGYRHQERDGTLRQGGAFFFSAAELPRPVDYVTDDISLAFELRGESWDARVGYDGSFFSNRQSDLVWSNPYTGPAQGRIALAPDNSASQFGGTFNLRFGPRTALSVGASYAQLKQDDDFLPYGINAGLVGPALPRTSLDGKVDVTHLDVTLTSGLPLPWDFLSSFRVKADFRYDDRDNRTPQAAYPYVFTDAFLTNATAPVNQPYGFSHTRFGLSGDYDLRQLLRFMPGKGRIMLSGGWRHDDYDRPLQEARKSHEDTGWAEGRYSPFGWLDISLKGGGANRKIDEWTALPATVPAQNPFMRKYNMANRERVFYEGSIGVRPVESLQFTLTGTYADNNYVSSPIGLRQNFERGATVNVDWSAAENVSVYGHYGWQRLNARQNGSQSGGVADWSVTSKDQVKTAGVGVRIANVAKLFDVDVEWNMADTDGNYATLFGTPPPQAFPTVRSRMNGGGVGVTYRANPALDLVAGVRYEHFDQDDWAVDNVGPQSVPNLLSMGALPYSHDVVAVRLSFRYRFGVEMAKSEEKPAEK